MTPSAVAAQARVLFATASIGVRVIQPLRVRICPVEMLLDAVPDGATVFDIGCGAGLLAGLLAPRVATVVGVDAAPSAIASAERMRGQLPPDQARRLRFAVAATSDGWPAGPFSVVTLIDVLHHVPTVHQQDVLAAAAARVAPGGILLCKDIPRRPRWRAFMNQLHDLVMARQWVHHPDGDALCAQLQTAGLLIERRTCIRRWWYAHELIIARRAAA